MKLYEYFVNYYDLASNVRDEQKVYWRSVLADNEAVKAEIESKENWSVTFIERLK